MESALIPLALLIASAYADKAPVDPAPAAPADPAPAAPATPADPAATVSMATKMYDLFIGNTYVFYGWIALLVILLAVAVYFMFFRKKAEDV